VTVKAGKSFSVRIFLQDGRADGVRVVSRSKWSGRGLVIPRSSLAAELDRAELKDPGVYLLTGHADAANRPSLYIGAADPVCDGLARSSADEQGWATAIVFTSKENRLSFAQCRLIVERLLNLARRDIVAISRVDSSAPARLDDAASAAAENFLSYMLSLYPLLGVTVFD
jgi:hypothetical protein